MKASFFVSPSILMQLSQQITAQLGWDYAPERFPDLQRGVAEAVRELGFTGFEDGARELLKSPFSARQIEVLASHLTTGETYFWREPRALEAFAAQVAPQIRRGAPLRIWSAGCAGGEEAYTLAMLLCEQLSPAQRTQISIFATDINPIFLEKARAGIYRDWSFRALPDALKSRYFSPRSAGNWEVAPELRAMTQFSALNLVAPMLPTPFDAPRFEAIFCRNVLIYFDEGQISRVLGRFEAALAPGGFLVVGPSEAARVTLGPFERLSVPGATLFQKTTDSATCKTFQQPPQISRVAATIPPFKKAAISPRSPSAAAHRKSLSLEGAHLTPDLKLDISALDEVRYAANAGDLEAALKGINQLIANDKLAAPLHWLRATILQSRNENEDALQALQRAIFLDGEFILAHYSLANLARAMGHAEMSRRALQTTRTLLARLDRDAILPESDGLTVGQLSGAVQNALRGDP